jgi:hypothetical protein
MGTGEGRGVEGIQGLNEGIKMIMRGKRAERL